MNYRQEEPSGNMFPAIVIILPKVGFLRALAILKQSVASLRGRVPESNQSPTAVSCHPSRLGAVLQTRSATMHRGRETDA
jgi:hypothetical protein